MLTLHVKGFSFWSNLFTLTNAATKLGHVRSSKMPNHLCTL